MKEREIIRLICNQNLEGLIQLRGDIDLETSPGMYLKAVIAYLKGDSETLKESHNELIELGHQELAALTHLRLAIRSKTVQESHIQEALSPQGETPWSGEAFFIAARAYFILEKYTEAKKYFHKAHQSLKALGAEKKALTALLNTIVVESHIHPEQKLLVDYTFLAKEAIKVGDFTIAGLAHLNISREFYFVDALSVALEHANQSLKYFNSDTGCIHYFEALLHRSQLHFDLGDLEKSKKDYQQTKIATFPEIRERFKQFEEKFRNLKSIDEKTVRVTPLTPLETQLLEFLSQNGREKREVIQFLYGDQIDPFAAENRFKVLLSRLRKKRPDLIQYKKGKYHLTENEELGVVV